MLTIIKSKKILLCLSLLLIIAVFLAVPGLAQADWTGRTVTADISGTMVVQRGDGSVLTIDHDGQLLVGYRGQQIVIDVIGAGILRENGEQVNFNLANTGTITGREDDRVYFDASGTLLIDRADGSQIVIDVISAGIVLKQPGRIIGIGIHGDGIVRGSGENIVIDVISAGVITN